MSYIFRIERGFSLIKRMSTDSFIRLILFGFKLQQVEVDQERQINLAMARLKSVFNPPNLRVSAFNSYDFKMGHLIVPITYKPEQCSTNNDKQQCSHWNIKLISLFAPGLFVCKNRKVLTKIETWTENK